MKKGKRLLVVLLATLVMLVGAVGMAYAVDSDYYVAGITESEDHSAATISNAKNSTVATATFKAETGQITYDGTSKPATIDVTLGDRYSVETAGKKYTLKYKETDTSSEISVGSIVVDDIYYVGTTAAGNEYPSTTTAPKKAGEYTASVVVKAYNPSNIQVGTNITITKTFTIAPKEINVAWTDNSDGNFTYTYDGENHAPTAKITTGLVQGDSVDVNVTGAAKTVATHTATANLIGPDAANYKIKDTGDNQTKTKEFTIAPKPLNVTWKGVNGGTDDNAFKFEYNGQQQGPTCELDKSGVVKGESCDIEVTGQQTNVGTYDGGTESGHGPKASASLTNSNYTIAGDNATKAFSIQEYTIVKLFWHPQSLVYNAGYQHPEATVSKAEGNEPVDPLECGLTYKVYKNSVADANLVAEGAKMHKGSYVVVASLDTEKNFKFDAGTNTQFAFTVTAKEVEVTLSIDTPIYYDSQEHKPEVTTTGVYTDKGDTCAPIVRLTGTTLSSVTVSIDDTTIEGTGTGAKHASSGNYTATVTGLKNNSDEDYVLKSNTTIQFPILPKEVTLDWYRPANNEYGEYLDVNGSVTSDVTAAAKVKTTGTTPKLVFNGKEQAPSAEIKEGMMYDGDTCTVTVSAPSGAVEVGTYTVTDIDFSNPDYTRAQSGQKYQIVQRPVRLAWDKFYASYTGVEQARTVTIENIQTDDYGDPYENKKGVVCEVSEVLYSNGRHFGTTTETDPAVSTDTDEPADSIKEYNNSAVPATVAAAGTAIDPKRIKIDAGTRTMTAGDLTDSFNYTYFKLTGDTVDGGKGTGTNDSTTTRVDLYDPIYTIHQHKINEIKWSNTTVTYNASNQKPVAELSKNDLQGPDTVKEVIVMIHDKQDSTADDFLGKCNAKTYTIYVLKNNTFRGIKGGKVDRSMNYRIDKDSDTKTKNLNSQFVINKRPLAVIANPKTIWYKDAPVNAGITYKGLINGDVNKDDNHQNKNVPGEYTPEGATKTKPVVEGKPVFTYSYAKNGKPGTYQIRVSGLSSDNYNINFVAGNLTVLDRYDYLNAKGTKSGKKGIVVSWNGITGATSYDVYMSLCNTKKKVYTPVYVGSTSGTSLKVTKIGKKKLKAKKAYKYYVVAKNASGAAIAQSDMGHFITNNVKGKKVNAKSMAVNTHSVSIAKGGTAGLSASYTKAKKGKKYKLLDAWHSPLTRYATENPAVATVDANGTVYGVGKGWTRVYVYGVSGMWETVEVYVN